MDKHFPPLFFSGLLQPLWESHEKKPRLLAWALPEIDRIQFVNLK